MIACGYGHDHSVPDEDLPSSCLLQRIRVLEADVEKWHTANDLNAEAGRVETDRAEKAEAALAWAEKHLRAHDCDFVHSELKSECWCFKRAAERESGGEQSRVATSTAAAKSAAPDSAYDPNAQECGT